MRRLGRTVLPLATRRELFQRSRLPRTVPEARTEWNSFRGSKPSDPLLDALRSMAGGTERCFYCGDSRGAEIEHFAPIAIDVSKTFEWRNLLLVCGPCNRQKSRAATSSDGERIFMDPTLDDPWDHLILVTQTGLVSPRYLLDGSVSKLGSYTLEKLSTLNHDAIADARRRVVRRLITAIQHVEQVGDTTQSRRSLLTAVEDDFFGVSTWFAVREGRTEEAVSVLRASCPNLWRRFSTLAGRS